MRSKKSRSVVLIPWVWVLLSVPVGVEGQARSAASRLQVSGGEVRLALSSVGGRRLVEVRVGNAGPYRFLIDTGSTMSIVDSGIASELGLLATGTEKVGPPGGDTVEADVVAVPVLHVGSLTARGVPMVVLGLAGMTGGAIQGVLGMDLFEDVVLTLDASREVAIVGRGSLSPDDPSVIRLDRTSEGVNFAMDVAGTRVPVHLDTGSPGGITLPVDLMGRLPLSSDSSRRGTVGMVGGNRSVVTRQLRGVVRVGAVEYRDPQIAFLDPSPPSGNFGSQMTDGLVVTVDQRSGLLSLRRSEGAGPDPAPPPPAAAPRRLGVRFGGAGGSLSSVASVDPGSLGERSGFRAGDVIVRLNGRPMAEYDVAALGDLIRGTTPLTWEIDRNGERVTIVVR